ncbi:MAG: alpha/beta hydrolase fold domain-containing protein [Candidatus Heimdallarchaeota archaeon]|nr:alpha/beta hydrolase fold domain-containing protein [Candidatus Heimdallarchaeota archaeon]
MHALSIVFLIVAVLLIIIFVLLAQTFLGLILTEIGLWVSWIPLIMIIMSIPFLVQYSMEHPRWDFFLLLLSTMLNLFTFIWLIRPFLRVYQLNKEFKKQISKNLGNDYLENIDPEIESRYSRTVRFNLLDYFKGIRKKQLEKSVKTINDIPYRTINNKTLKLNIYYPKQKGKYPTILYVHGGGWIMGSKDKLHAVRVLKKIASLGYVIFSINYRLAIAPTFTTLTKIPHNNPTIREMVSDVRTGLIFARKNTGKYFGDERNFFLFGRSAGAHLALLTAFSCEKKFFEMEGIKCSKEQMALTGVMAFYPMTDIKELYEYYEKIGAPVLKQSIYRGTGTLEKNENLYKIFSPINYVNKKNVDKIPPVFLATGKMDRLVDAYQSEELYEELQGKGIKSVFLEFPWANHGFDSIVNGPGGQLVFQYLSQFLVWSMSQKKNTSFKMSSR